MASFTRWKIFFSHKEHKPSGRAQVHKDIWAFIVSSVGWKGSREQLKDNRLPLHFLLIPNEFRSKIKTGMEEGRKFLLNSKTEMTQSLFSAARTRVYSRRFETISTWRQFIWVHKDLNVPLSSSDITSWTVYSKGNGLDSEAACRSDAIPLLIDRGDLSRYQESAQAHYWAPHLSK